MEQKKKEINKYSFDVLVSYAYAAPSCGIPMELRTKLRPWKNNTKKIHIKAKELSFLEMSGEREREEKEEGRKERERGT